MQKTVVIWDSCDANVKFFVVDKDVSHLDRKYVNDARLSDKENEEICYLVFDSNGQEKVLLSTEFPVDAVKAGAKIIVAGFLP